MLRTETTLRRPSAVPVRPLRVSRIRGVLQFAATDTAARRPPLTAPQAWWRGPFTMCLCPGCSTPTPVTRWSARSITETFGHRQRGLHRRPARRKSSLGCMVALDRGPPIRTLSMRASSRRPTMSCTGTRRRCPGSGGWQGAVLPAAAGTECLRLGDHCRVMSIAIPLSEASTGESNALDMHND